MRIAARHRAATAMVMFCASAAVDSANDAPNASR
jgi:hypothetical protein